MSQPTPFQTWYGRNTAPAKIESLKAGRLAVEFQEGDLRYLRFGGQEFIRRIYVAVRDANWNTIPGQISGLAVQQAGDSFHITYSASHADGPIRFLWQATIEGRPDGTIEFALDGVAEGDFHYNRIGFCLLYPIEGFAGRSYQAETPNGEINGRLPELVEPQRIENGFEAPIFPSCSSLTVTLDDGAKITARFEGDLFEMEDQRNWTDGSFKTYCTPLSLGYPRLARAGQVFHQKIMLQPSLPVEAQAGDQSQQAEGIWLSVGEETGQRLPRLGFGISPAAHQPRELERLARLRPDHLKAELHFDDPDCPDGLEKALAVAGPVGSPLELALFLNDDSRVPFEALKQQLKDVRVARVIVFHEAEAARATTRTRWVRLAREELSGVLPGVPFLGGTNGNFAQLNRSRPETAAMDGVSYTINPQVHATDERSLVEAIEGQRDTVLTARSFSGGLPVSISSVTLKPPFNVVATQVEGPAGDQDLPASVDPRQMSLFGAAWTVGSIRSLAEGGAESVTYFETTGWCGLMEGASGSRLPEQFPSFPGMAYPLYAVFAFLAEAKGAALLQVKSRRPLSANALALQKGNRAWLLVSNYEPRDQLVRVSEVLDGRATRIRLNEETFELAVTKPEAFLAGGEDLEVTKGEVVLRLKPYETALIEVDQRAVNE